MMKYELDLFLSQIKYLAYYDLLQKYVVSTFLNKNKDEDYTRTANRQTSGESASLPQYLGCNTVFDMRLRVTFLRRKTVSLQSNIAHRE